MVDSVKRKLKRMGAKASTPATSGHQSPRSRTFSSSSTGTELQNATVDRQRARSLSSVPDIHGTTSNTTNHDNQQHLHAGPNHGDAVVTGVTGISSSSYYTSTATSLPSQIWSFNGILLNLFIHLFLIIIIIFFLLRLVCW